MALKSWQDHVRIACFMTDGYVGNDMEIIAEVQKHANARVFGSSVNHFLLDKMAQYGLQSGTTRTEVREAITQLGLDYSLMTQFTSFVAVEELTVTEAGQPKRIDVPVEMAEGVNYAGVFGEPQGETPLLFASQARSKRMIPVAASAMLEIMPPSPPPSTSKLHPDLAAIVDRLKKGGRPNGKAAIQIWLNDTSPKVLEQLRQLGFEVAGQPKTAKVLIGRLPVAKLAALAEVAAVRYVTPLQQR